MRTQPQWQGYIDYICQNKNAYYRIAVSFLGNEADSLDAISQMTLIIMEKYQTLRNAGAFVAWSKQILINVCRSKLRERKKTVLLEFPIEPELEPQLDRDSLLLVRQKIAELPLKHREVIILRYYNDLEYQDIAELLDIPLGTVKSRLNRAIATLKTTLGGDFNE